MVFINGISNISPQPTLKASQFLDEIREYRGNMLQCIQPDYKDFLSANELRRMSKALKMGVAGANLCLEDASLSSPESIIIGTGKGCYKSTEVFLFSVEDNKEKFIPPSPFIQSSHGSIASQIAIQTGCKGYNMTYSHRAFSFESALIDAMMILKEGDCENVLVGGVDEIEQTQFGTFDRIGFWKKPDTNNLELLNDNTAGTIAGEGSAFFSLGNKINNNTYAEIKSVYTYFKSGRTKNASVINAFLKKQGMETSEIDLVFFGLNGDNQFDQIYYDLMKKSFNSTNQAWYKHLCGEYHASTAFATWLAAKIIKHQLVPKILQLRKINNMPIKNILIYNQYRNKNHSLILVSDKDS